MCQTSTKRSSKMSENFPKVAVILAFLFFAECAAGSCLSYGHACWGAHGKRSNSQTILSGNDQPSLIKDEAKAKWFLSKLLNPLELRYYRDDEEADKANRKNNPNVEDLFTDIDEENIKKPNEWEYIQELLRNDNRKGFSERIGDDIKSRKFLDKRSTKDQ